MLHVHTVDNLISASAAAVIRATRMADFVSEDFSCEFSCLDRPSFPNGVVESGVCCAVDNSAYLIMWGVAEPATTIMAASMPMLCSLVAELRAKDLAGPDGRTLPARVVDRMAPRKMDASLLYSTSHMSSLPSRGSATFAAMNNGVEMDTLTLTADLKPKAERV